jgi:hypothetical protein
MGDESGAAAAAHDAGLQAFEPRKALQCGRIVPR